MLYILTLWIRGFHICLSFWWLLCHKYASQDQSGPRGEGDQTQDVYFARRRAAFAETACCRFWLESNFTCGGGGATPELLCSKICFCMWIHMAFEHYNSIPGQWLDTCQAAAGPGRARPGRAAAGPGQAARLLRVKNPEVQRILGNVTPRSGWQRCLSNYRVSLFFTCSLIVVIVLRLQCFQHFLFVFCVF